MEDLKILFVIAFNGFQHTEYEIPKNIIEDAGFTVVTASDKLGAATAHDGSIVLVDLSCDKVSAHRYAGIIFIGGPGALDHLDNNTSYKIIQEALHQNIPVGAICIAPRILAHAGVLHSKQATGWNEDGQLAPLYKEHHVKNMAPQSVVTDDNIVTATGPQAAQEFGECFVNLLQKKQSWG